MIVSVTKLELVSYSKLAPFFSFNTRIIAELKQSKCVKFKVSCNWNFKTWYTMSVWETENDLHEFYRNGTHLEAMKAARGLANKLESRRIQGEDFISWGKVKKLFEI